MAQRFTSGWYALYVRSRHEKIVHAQLQAKQHQVFLPLYRNRRRQAERWRVSSLPLFPGYVFCQFDLSLRSSVMSTSGVIDVVRVGTEPAQIDQCEIEAIQLVVDSPLAAEPYGDLVKGDRVTMTEGPLKGLSGTLKEVRSSLRLVVSVELLCRSVLVEIDRDWVTPCISSASSHLKWERDSIYSASA
jgi:transcription antitermination factor NusG